jgi:ABC-type transporter Mla maintaining outer membrane lipid asymmetry ATPase subunit MlaF
MKEEEAQIELAEADIARGEIVSRAAIIEAVSWSVRAGDFWAVGGLPGAGKTDLLGTAAGLQRPLKGSHRLFGVDTRELDEQQLVERRLRVGMVFGNGRLFPRLTIAENIALPICYHSNWPGERAADEVKEALQITGLEHIAERRPGQVTRNLHQRIGLARALALQPEVLLIDNPLLGVDPRQGRWWLDFLSQLAKGHPVLGRKLTIVIAADDFRPWLETARQFAVIEEKGFRVLGSNQEVKKSTDTIVRELLTPTFQEI